MAIVEQTYFAADAEAQEERARLRDLEEVHDAWTVERLTALGVDTGWRCLEVGAGGGSVAGWLADRAAHVVATDLDPRFLGPLAERDNVEVRRHDITRDDLEQGAFDLAHCRMVLMHLADPAAALERMAQALRPGGVLLVEEADAVTLTPTDPSHPRAELFGRVYGAMWGGLRDAGIFDPYFGRTLPTLVRDAGLVDTGNRAVTRVFQPPGTNARLAKASMERLRGPVMALGLCSEQDYDEYLGVLDDPTFEGYSLLIVQAWGCRAEG